MVVSKLYILGLPGYYLVADVTNINGVVVTAASCVIVFMVWVFPSLHLRGGEYVISKVNFFSA